MKVKGDDIVLMSVEEYDTLHLLAELARLDLPEDSPRRKALDRALAFQPFPMENGWSVDLRTAAILDQNQHQMMGDEISVFL